MFCTETDDLRRREGREVERISTRGQSVTHRLEEKVLLHIRIFMDLGSGFLTHHCIGTRTLR